MKLTFISNLHTLCMEVHAFFGNAEELPVLTLQCPPKLQQNNLHCVASSMLWVQLSTSKLDLIHNIESHFNWCYLLWFLQCQLSKEFDFTLCEIHETKVPFVKKEVPFLEFIPSQHFNLKAKQFIES